jgi:hypothetical protein
VSALFFHIHELSEQRARCLLAARVARCVGESDLVRELVMEARGYHKALLVQLGAVHRSDAPRPQHAFSMHVLASHRGWLTGSKMRDPARRPRGQLRTQAL